MKNSKIILCALLGGLFAPALLAEEINSFKKQSVMGLKDGKPQLIDTADLTPPIQAELTGMFLEFEFNGSKYKLKASDTNFDGTVQRTCLPGEIKYTTANQQIGGTQMGSGESACVSN